MGYIGRVGKRRNSVGRASGALIAMLALLLQALAVPAVADQAEDQFNFATGLFIEGDYELAAEEYEAFLAKHAGNPLAGDAQFRLGESLMRLERFKDAVAPLQDYVKRGDTKPDQLAAAYFRLGRAHTELESYETAAGFYGAFVQKFPKHEQAPGARYWAGECSLRAGKFAEAGAAFQQALPQVKGGQYESFCIYGLASSLMSLTQYGPAAQHLQDVVNRFGEESFAPDAALRLAQCYSELKRPDDALRAYETVERLHGDKLLPEALMGKATVLYRTGKLQQAAALFGKVAAEHTGHELAPAAGFNAGSALFNLNRYGQALPLFEALAAKEGQYRVASLYWQGMCLLELERPADALNPLLAAEAEGEYQVRARFAVGDAQYELGQLDQARKSYEALVAQFPGDDLADDALHAAATAAAALKDNADALALAARLIKDYPGSPLAGRARFLTGDALFRQGKFAQAAEVFNALLAQEAPGVGQERILYKLAWCAYRQEKPEDATALFRRVAAEHPDSDLAGESLYMAGKLLSDLALHEDALAVYDECVAKYPRSSAAANAAYAGALAEFSLKNWQGAAERFNVFLAAHTDSDLVPQVRFYLAESQFGAEQFDAARSTYAALVKDHPDSDLVPEALYGAAWCLRQKGAHKGAKGAVAAFEAVQAEFPKSATGAKSLYWAGRSLMDMEQYEAARARFAEVLAHPQAGETADAAAYSTANCLLQEKAYDEAIESYAAFLAEYPKSDRRVRVLYDLAWAHRGRGEEERARQYFLQVGEQADATGLKGDALFRVAEVLYGEERYEQAARLYTRIIALEEVGFLDKAWYKLGWCREKLGQWPEALEAYRKVAQDHPESDLAADSALRAARMLQQTGKHEDAVAELAGLLQRPGLHEGLAARARFAQAESLRSLGKWVDALPLYRALVGPDSGFQPAYSAHFGVGTCTMELGAFTDATDAFNRVIEQTETETAARAQLALGEVLYRQKEFAEAGRAFLKVNILYGYPKWKARGLLRAAQAFDKAGRKDRAERYLKKLTTDFPESEDAAEAAKLLEE